MVERRWRTAGTWLRALFYFNAVLLQWPCLATTPDNNVDSTIARGMNQGTIVIVYS